MDNNNYNQSKRIEWVDIARGWGMLLVIIGHITEGHLERWIYSFHVPLFFFLSGFVFSRKNSPAEFIKGKLKTLILPYFSLGGIIVLFQYLFEGFVEEAGFAPERLLHKITDLFVQIRCWDLWFLGALVVLELLFYLISGAGLLIGKKLGGKSEVRGNRIGLILILVLSLLVTILGHLYYDADGVGLYWNADVSLVAMIFFGAGYVCRKIRVFSYLERKKVSIPLFVLAWGVNLFAWRLNYVMTHRFLDLYMGSFGNIYLSYLAAFAGTLGVISFSMWFAPGIVDYVGSHTLVYFCWHQSIMIPLMKWLFSLVGILPDPDNGIYDSDPVQLVLFVSVFLLVSGCSILINRSPLRKMIGKD